MNLIVIAVLSTVTISLLLLSVVTASRVSFPQIHVILSELNKEPKPGVTPARVLQKKKDSWDMAKKLYQAGRIGLDTALYGLKSSGHTKEEAVQWLKEVKE